MAMDFDHSCYSSVGRGHCICEGGKRWAISAQRRRPMEVLEVHILAHAVLFVLCRQGACKTMQTFVGKSAAEKQRAAEECVEDSGVGGDLLGMENGGLPAQRYVPVPGGGLGANLGLEGGVGGNPHCLCQGSRGGGQGTLLTLGAPGAGVSHNVNAGARGGWRQVALLTNREVPRKVAG